MNEINETYETIQKSFTEHHIKMMANEFAGLYIEVDKKPLKLSKKIKENWEDCLFFIAEKLELIAEKIKPY